MSWRRYGARWAGAAGSLRASGDCRSGAAPVSVTWPGDGSGVASAHRECRRHRDASWAATRALLRRSATLARTGPASQHPHPLEQKRRDGAAADVLATQPHRAPCRSDCVVQRSRASRRLAESDRDYHTSPEVQLKVRREPHARSPRRVEATIDREAARSTIERRELRGLQAEHRHTKSLQHLDGPRQIENRFRAGADHCDRESGSALSGSADTSPLSSTSRCTPPIPPVANTRIPARVRREHRRRYGRRARPAGRHDRGQVAEIRLRVHRGRPRVHEARRRRGPRGSLRARCRWSPGSPRRAAPRLRAPEPSRGHPGAATHASPVSSRAPRPAPARRALRATRLRCGRNDDCAHDLSAPNHCSTRASASSQDVLRSDPVPTPRWPPTRSRSRVRARLHRQSVDVCGDERRQRTRRRRRSDDHDRLGRGDHWCETLLVRVVKHATRAPRLNTTKRSRPSTSRGSTASGFVCA